MGYPLTFFIPPLEQGDHLTRLEFESRYAVMPHLKKAELLEGIVYMASPLRFESHAEPHAFIMGWLVYYCAATPGVRLGDNATVRLDDQNEVQPDACLRLPAHLGGQSRISPDDYIEGSPELMVEVAASSVSYDLHEKKKLYCRHGVQEYIVWRVFDKQVDWFVLKGGEYVALLPDARGHFHSQLFPGLVLDSTALLKGDLITLFGELQKGLQTSAHQDLVKSLANQQLHRRAESDRALLE